MRLTAALCGMPVRDIHLFIPDGKKYIQYVLLFLNSCVLCELPHDVRSIKFSEVPDAQAGSLGTEIGILDHAEQQIRMHNNNAIVCSLACLSAWRPLPTGLQHGISPNELKFEVHPHR